MSRINPLASPSAGAPALKYGDINTETTSPGEVKGLINNNTENGYKILFKSIKYIIPNFFILSLKALV